MRKTTGNLARKTMVFLLLMLVFAQAIVLADQIEIKSYNFDITGKTKDFILRDTISSDEPELFNTEEELVTALNTKKQSMVNRRIFSVVEYTYTLGPAVDSIIPCDVNFTIVDSRTVLFLPYPKYDSNYGLTMGIKGYNTNLFGRLSSLNLTLNATQVDHSFKKGSYYGALTISNLNLDKILFSLDITANFDLVTTGNTYVTFGIGSQNLRIGEIPVNINPWVQIKPMGATNKDDWRIYEIGNSFGVGPFLRSIGGISLSNYIRFRNIDPNASSHPLYTSSSITYHGIPKISLSLSATTDSDYKTGKIDDLEIGPTVGHGFSLFGWVNWNNSLSHRNYINFNNSTNTPRLVWGSSLSRSSINWYDDFRKGLEFSISSNVDFYYAKDKNSAITEKLPWYINTSIVHFPIQTAWFNPSFRIMGIYSNTPQYFLASSSYDIADYLRGIRKDNVFTSTAAVYKTAYVLNANLTFKFIRLADFVKTYAIAFTDIAIFNDPGNPGEYRRLTTVGLEGVGILVRYPSYPIRASLGFNLDDLIKKFKGTLEGKIEYEIFIGMGFYF